MKNNLMQSIPTTKEADKFLRSLGYIEKQNHGGSHRIYTAPNRATISLPDHNRGKAVLSEGVRRNILKLALGESYYQK